MSPEDADAIIQIERRVCESLNPYAALGEYALKLALLSSSDDGVSENSLRERFDEIVEERALGDAPEFEARYLLSLLVADNLLFEEIAKIFSLLEELVAFEQLGLRLPDSANAEIRKAFSAWLARDQKRVRTVAKELGVDARLSKMWFYEQVFH